MKEHITYLFGAGASAGVMPVDNQLTDKLKHFLESCQAHIEGSTEKGYLQNFVTAHSWLMDDFKNEKSLDVIAKKYETNEHKLFQIKTLIWFFFSAHAGKNRLDSRYGSLLTRLAGNNSLKAPVAANVSFLSWNYDLQLEEAYSTQKEVKFHKTPEHLYSLPGIKFWRDDYKLKKSYPPYFQLIHLNGSAGYFYPQPDTKTPFWCNCDLEAPSGIDELARFYGQELCTNRSVREGIRDSLSFSWEDTSLVNEIKQAAIRQAARTTHLVIIGYSLPDLNRHFDLDFFNAMKNLKEVIIQDKGAAESIQKILLKRYPDIFKHVDMELDNETSSFRIPDFFS